MSEILKKKVKEIIDRESEKLKAGGTTRFNSQWYSLLERIIGSSDAYARKIKDAFGIEDDLYKLIERRTSLGLTRIGDLLTFSYKGANFMVIVVKNKRTMSGRFTSTRGNKLLSSYRVDHLSMDTLQIVLNVLNKYENVKDNMSYEKRLNGFLSLVGGADKYRTFDTTGIFSLKKVSIGELDPRGVRA